MSAAVELLHSATDVEAQFYRALATADLELMMRCWVDDDEVSCVPPGGELLRGLAAVRELFEALFARGSVGIQIRNVQALSGIMHSVHTLEEVITVQTESGLVHALVYATNVYIKTPLGWRLQAHHASPGRLSGDLPATAPRSSTPTLH